MRVKTFEAIAQRQELGVIPTKAMRTQAQSLNELTKLQAVFGWMPIEAI